MVAGSWLRFGRWKIFGAAIYVHQYVLVASAALFVLALKNWLLAITCLASYIAIIFVHEVGHAAIARRLGYDVTAIRIGLLHGRCEYEHPDSAWDASLVSWGGVLAQLLIAALVFAIAGVVSGSFSDRFGPIVIFLGYMNIIIAAVNLTPRAPFDGYLAWRILPAILEKVRARLSYAAQLGVPRSASNLTIGWSDRGTASSASQGDWDKAASFVGTATPRRSSATLGLWNVAVVSIGLSELLS